MKPGHVPGKSLPKGPPNNLPFAVMSFIMICQINLCAVQLQGVRYPQGYPLLLVQGFMQLWCQLRLRRQLSVQDLQSLSCEQPLGHRDLACLYKR